jgi:hypothetical protein
MKIKPTYLFLKMWVQKQQSPNNFFKDVLKNKKRAF